MPYLDKFHLDKSSKKYLCPGCGKKTFVIYVNAETKIAINEHAFGRCDRENHCSYHVKPDFKTKEGSKTLVTNIIYPSEDVLKTILEKPSPLHKFLQDKISPEFLYQHGVYSDKGLTAYVFRNIEGKLCNIKWFKYLDDGHRDKEFQSFSIKQPAQRNEYVEEKFTVCLFGENELDQAKKKIVCVVESEKTKVIAQFYYPEFDWAACGSANGLSDGSEGTADKITPLKGRTVYWIGDADKASRGKMREMEKTKKQEWFWCSSIRNGIKYIDDFHVVDLWPDRDDGYDIGDALLEGLKPEIKPTWSKAQQDKRYKSYCPPSDVRMKKEYEGGLQIGETSCINNDFDNVYSWMRTHVNSFYGWSKDGKSLMTEFLSIVKAKKSGWKTCMFKQEDMGSFFENGKAQVTADRIYAKLVWMYTGITPFEHFAKKNNTPLLPWEKYQEVMQWIKDHFFIVYPTDRKYRNILDEFLFFYETFGIDHFVIDPWNTVGLDNIDRGDERLVQAFVHAKEFVLKTNSVMSIVNHPGSRHEVKEKNGAYKVVSQFMQLGGSAWDIKMDGQFSCHRPFRHKVANDPRVHFYNLNQRDSEIVGAERGCYEKIEFDRKRRQYYFDGLCPIDGSFKNPIQAEIEYTPSWKKGRKKKDKSFDEHVQQDWTAPVSQTSDLPDWVTEK